MTLSYPSNIPGLPGHNWANGIAMATPIAHKGVHGRRQGAGDDAGRPAAEAGSRSRRRGTTSRTSRRATQKYEPLIRPQDQPAIELNRDIMAKYREQMKKYYFDPTKYKTYLEQLGIKYPTIKK